MLSIPQLYALPFPSGGCVVVSVATGDSHRQNRTWAHIQNTTIEAYILECTQKSRSNPILFFQLKLTAKGCPLALTPFIVTVEPGAVSARGSVSGGTGAVDGPAAAVKALDLDVMGKAYFHTDSTVFRTVSSADCSLRIASILAQVQPSTCASRKIDSNSFCAAYKELSCAFL